MQQFNRVEGGVPFPSALQGRAVHTQYAEDVGLELLVHLLSGERFQGPL